MNLRSRENITEFVQCSLYNILAYASSACLQRPSPANRGVLQYSLRARSSHVVDSVAIYVMLTELASSYSKCEICTRVRLVYFALVHIHRYVYIYHTSLSRAQAPYRTCLLPTMRFLSSTSVCFFSNDLNKSFGAS